MSKRGHYLHAECPQMNAMNITSFPFLDAIASLDLGYESKGVITKLITRYITQHDAIIECLLNIHLIYIECTLNTHWNIAKHGAIHI